MTTIDVIVPTLGGLLTDSCVRHLSAQTAAHRTFVVDNGSPDDTVQRIRSAFPDVDVIEMGENRGFAGAVNHAINLGEGEIVVLVNSDVDVAPDLLAQLAEPFDDPRVGSAAPLLLRPGGRQIDSFGIAGDPTLAGFVRLHGRPVDAIDALEPPPLLGPYGAVAAYRRSALAEVGPLDERLFLYGEEFDLALRLRAAGWLAAGVPTAGGIHIGGATAGRGSAWQRRQGGFARGYLLRRYGILSTRQAARALLTEAIVVAGDLALSRDLAALRGRVAGWRAARDLPRRAVPPGLGEIGFFESLRLRRGNYAPASRFRRAIARSTCSASASASKGKR